MSLWRSTEGWSYFLEGLSLALASELPLPDSLDEWGESEPGWPGRMARRLAAHIRKGMPLQQAIQADDLAIPIQIRKPLGVAAQYHVLMEVSALLSQRLKRYRDQRYRIWSAWIYTFFVVCVGWCGMLVIVTNVIPAIAESIRILNLKPIAWFKYYEFLYERRWQWFFGGPVLVLIVLWLWRIWIAFGKHSLETYSVHFRRIPAKWIELLKLAAVLANKRDALSAVALSQQVYSTNEKDLHAVGIDLTQWKSMGVSNQSASQYLVHLSEIAQERERIYERYWIDTLPFRITLFVGSSVVMAYLVIALIPMTWMIIYAFEVI